MKWLVLVLLTGCAFDAVDNAIWVGTIQRDGTPVPFVGYDPAPNQGFEFGSSPKTIGYIEANDEKFLVQILLHFEDDDFESMRSTAFPITLPIKDSFMISETGMGIDYFEQPAADKDATDTAQVFHHDFAQHEANSSTGTFTVTASDYETFFDGRLQVSMTDNDNPGSGSRVLDIQVHWTGDK
jgi:hypothetical protein